jgi:serine/threonine-protein kinase SRPK3
MYGPGGHHPVNLGVVVGHRFKIIHKLGNGGFALVWLARDLDQDRYVALKILKANAPDREIKVLEHLKNAAGNVRITNLHETFTIRGPNGLHQCLVLDLGGPSLGHVTLYCKRPPVPFLKAAARKLAEGLAALHAAGVCHGGKCRSRISVGLAPLTKIWTSHIPMCFSKLQVFRTGRKMIYIVTWDHLRRPRYYSSMGRLHQHSPQPMSLTRSITLISTWNICQVMFL